MELNTYWIVVRNNHLHFAVNNDFSHNSHQKNTTKPTTEAFQNDKNIHTISHSQHHTFKNKHFQAL